MAYRTLAAAFAICTALLGPTVASPARACSPSDCAPGAFLPIAGSLPENAVQFLWRPPSSSRGDAGTSALHLYRIDGSQRTELTVAIDEGPGGLKLVRPTAPVAAGSSLLLESDDPECHGLSAAPARVSISQAQPVPERLGSVTEIANEARTTLYIPTSSGSCSDNFEVASSTLSLSLDPAAEPFADSMRHALVVDGTVRPQPRPTPERGAWPSPRLDGMLRDVLYTLCTRPSDAWTNDVSPGAHRVQWLATLIDGTELRSDEISISLACDAAAGTASDASVEVDVGAASDADSGEAAMNPAQTDAAARSGEPGSNAEFPAAAPLDSDGAATHGNAAGDSCTLSTGASRFPAPELLLFTALVFRRRRARWRGRSLDKRRH